jgi:cell division topological specificity factor
MGFMDLFRRNPKNTAQTAKERLLIIVAQERAARDSQDYLPTLKRELLEVIRKYINVPPEAVEVNVNREGDVERFELSVALPDKRPG